MLYFTQCPLEDINANVGMSSKWARNRGSFRFNGVVIGVTGEVAMNFRVSQAIDTV